MSTPAFYLILDTRTGGEVYNLIIRGGNEGGPDGINVWGSNIHIYDVEMTNKDESVTIKNSSNHFLIENIYCNSSEGSCIGSPGVNTDISKITYSNIYTWQSNNTMMLKSSGENGTVSDYVLQNFIVQSNAYSLNLNAYWTDENLAAGDGVLYTDLAFNNWKRTSADGEVRAPINAIYPTDQPCHGITIEDFAMWTDSGSYESYKRENAWGSGGCLRGEGEHTAFAVSIIKISVAPSGYSVVKMPNDLATEFDLSSSIPIPTIPTTFFPSATPAAKRAYP